MMNHPDFSLSQTSAKYRNMRASLLLILIFSAINLFSPLAGFYMLFSAYIPLVIVDVGAYFYMVQGMTVVAYVVAVAMAFVTLVPYLLCWIFSKKHVGWMIAALVLFSIDTLFFLIDLFSYLALGDYSFLLDLVFHAWVLVSLILGVKYGLDMKKEALMEQAALASAPQTEGEAENVCEGARQITLTRKKSIVGCAMRMAIYQNGQMICELKNGESKTVSVPAQGFTLAAAFTGGLVSNQIPIAAGTEPLSFTLVVKSGFIANTILFVPDQI